LMKNETVDGWQYIHVDENIGHDQLRSGRPRAIAADEPMLEELSLFVEFIDGPTGLVCSLLVLT
jgi:hypothetical protein